MVLNENGATTDLRVRVEHGEVGHDDRHGKRDGQYTGQCAQRADEHAHVGFGRHVAVSDRGHGHDSPPQSFRDALEVVLRIGLRR